MHTDFPLKKSVYRHKVADSKIEKEYSGSLWDSSKVIDAVNNIDTVLCDSINYFYEKFTEYYPMEFYPIKIYLENTTKVSTLEPQGTVEYLSKYLLEHSDQCNLFGLCVDTEHEYAVTGKYYNKFDIASLACKYSIIVHLNCVPSEVKPLLCKDRHSNTTIFECSLNDKWFYLDMVKFLEESGIYFVREVHEETMNREIEQLNKLVLDDK